MHDAGIILISATIAAGIYYFAVCAWLSWRHRGTNWPDDETWPFKD